MSRFAHLRRLVLLSFATLGVAVACRAALPEGQPMGPRPGPVTPTANPVPKPPKGPDTPGPTFPVPAPPPAEGPITVREAPSPIYAPSAEAYAGRDGGTGGDGALSDAAALPPAIPDAIPNDASKTLQP